MSEISKHYLFNDASFVNYWPLENNSNDAKGANNGTDTTMTYPAGKFGLGGNFNGSGYISFGNINNFERTDSFSISLWFKQAAATQGQIIGKQKSASQFNGWYLTSFNNPLLRWGMTDSGGGALFGDIAVEYGDNIYHHAVGTYNGSQLTSGLLLYIDGAPVTLSYTNTLAATIQTTFNLQAGARDGANLLYTGKIDDIGIWTRVLTPIEIQSLYSASGFGLNNFEFVKGASGISVTEKAR